MEEQEIANPERARISDQVTPRRIAGLGSDSEKVLILGEEKKVVTLKQNSVSEAAALRILDRVGMRVTHATLLDRLEAYGARVSRSDGVVRMPPRMVEKAVEVMRTVGRCPKSMPGPSAEEFAVSFGDSCFFLWDYQVQSPRRATREDFITTVRFADATPEIKAFQPPVEIVGLPAKTMTLEMQALCYLHAGKPSVVENNVPEQKLARLTCEQARPVSLRPEPFGRTTSWRRLSKRSRACRAVLDHVVHGCGDPRLSTRISQIDY